MRCWLCKLIKLIKTLIKININETQLGRIELGYCLRMAREKEEVITILLGHS